MPRVSLLPLWALLLALPAPVAGQARDQIRYETRFRDAVLKQIRERDKKRTEEQGKKTGAIRERQKAQAKKKRAQQTALVASLPAARRPASPRAFSQLWHNKPVAQYMTGTCWSFSATSLLESEVQRLSGRKIKLSEMHTVYHEYIEKARRYVRERGKSRFAEGSEDNAVTRIYSKYGAVPHSAYPGVLARDKLHDHMRMVRQMKALLQMVKREGLWEEKKVLGMLRVILDRHLGRPPKNFRYKGKRHTPRGFLKKVLRINPAHYVDLMSTLAQPFYRRVEFKVPDNWWHDKNYHNVPLPEFYAALAGALRKGYSVSIAVDVSEPGKDAANDTMFVPSYDIPGSHIDQHSREYRIKGRVTTDDHGVHLVGHARHDGHDWFLVKDSGRSARRGKYKGYYFLRDDYVRLKVLTFMVHRDAVKALLGKFKKDR